jgi:hypothetical protein
MMCYVEYLTFFLNFDYAKPGIVTTAFIIQVVDERSFDTVCKYYANKAYASRQDGMFFLDNFTVSPDAVMCVSD